RFLERAGIDPADHPVKNPYRLSVRQATAILDMRLHRLTGLQQEKLADEFRELVETIKGLRNLLDNEPVLIAEMIRELTEIKEKYGDERRTQILESSGELSMEDLVEDEATVLTMTKAGYIKTTPADAYKAQNRGGRGRKGAVLRDDEDMVIQVLAATAHKTILFFTDTGRVFKEKMYSLPKGGPNSRGKAIINFLGLQNEEKIVTMLSVADMESEDFIFFVTQNGIVKKTAISQFANINQNGIIAIKIDEGDHLIAANITDGTRHIFLGTKDGYANRFPEDNVRGSGRATRGVKGINLRAGDRVVGASILDPTDEHATVLSISEMGFGKRSNAVEYTPHKRGSMGVISLQTTDRNGSMIACMVVEEGQHLIVLTENGILIRVAISDLRVQSRNTQGVTIMRLDQGDRIIDVTLLKDMDTSGEDSEDEDEEAVDPSEDSGDFTSPGDDAGDTSPEPTPEPQ
ncbi:DNA gyrase subunit A, partial [Myxococcota bacterium]|nr:DNA gyrase subunit A [Myxococcota bacterium]